MIWSAPKMAQSEELSTAQMADIVARFRAKISATKPIVPTRAFGATGLELPVVSFGAWQYMHQAQLNSKRELFGFARTHTAMRAVAVGTGLLAACGTAVAVTRRPALAPAAAAGAIGGAVAGALGFCAVACAFNAVVVSNVQAMLRFAKPLGLLHVETARLYNTSEQILGRALRGMSTDERDGFVFQTKVRPMEDIQEFERTVRLSLRLMGGAPVKLLSLHGINSAQLGEWALKCCTVLERLRDEEGLLTYIGFSTHGDSKVIASMVDSGKFDYVNIHAHFFGAYTAQDNWPVVQAAKQRGMGVFIISPSFQGGRLHNPSERLAALTAPLKPAEFHALWLLSQPGVCTISLGVETTAEMEAARATVELLPIANQLLPTIENRLRRAVQEALPRQWQSRWWEGIPTAWDENCPGHLHILSQLRGFALVKALDMIYYANDMDNNLGWCERVTTLQKVSLER